MPLCFWNVLWWRSWAATMEERPAWQPVCRVQRQRTRIKKKQESQLVTSDPPRFKSTWRSVSYQLALSSKTRLSSGRIFAMTLIFSSFFFNFQELNCRFYKVALSSLEVKEAEQVSAGLDPSVLWGIQKGTALTWLVLVIPAGGQTGRQQEETSFYSPARLDHGHLAVLTKWSMLVRGYVCGPPCPDSRAALRERWFRASEP